MYKDHCQEIDLILTDLLMPGLSGMEMLQSMQAINPELKVIVMSGYSELISRMHESGSIGGKLAKPFGVYQLTREITQMLAGSSPGAIDDLRCGAEQVKDHQDHR